MRLKIAIVYFCTLALASQPLPKYRDLPFVEPLNTQNVEYNPIISPDGRYLVFQSNRPGGEGGMDIWVSENKSFPDRMKTPVWSEPKNFRELNSPNFEGMFSILFDENEKPYELYFTSVRNQDSDPKKNREGFDELNIYFTKINARTGNWSVPIHLNEINSHFEDKMPAISPDGCSMIFSSNRPGGWGGFDLWMSKRAPTSEDKKLQPKPDKPFLKCKEGIWQKPINLGKQLNSAANEIMPSFHWDGNRIYFSSDKEDQNKKFSYFYSEFDMILGEFSEIRLLGMPFNTSRKMSPNSTGYPFDTPNDYSTYSLWEESDNEGLSVTFDDLWFYYASNRPGGKGQFDIYRTQVPEDLRRTYDFVFRGLVLDGSENLMIGLDSTIKIFDGTIPIQVITSKRIGGDLSGSDLENFSTTLKTGKLYRVEVSSPGFQPNEISLDLRGNIGRNKEQYSKIILQAIKPEKPKRFEIPENAYRFIVKDRLTLEVISESEITYFDDKNRRGSKLKKFESVHYIEKQEIVDFELLTKAKDYKTETFIFSKDKIEGMKGKETVLFLRNLKDFNPLYNAVIYFPFNQKVISDEDKMVLDQLALHLIATKEESLEIGGHTDNVGSKEYNIKLSEDRAKAVFEYLLSKKVPTKQMKIQAYYYSQPIEENETETGRAKNRRVNFKRLD